MATEIHDGANGNLKKTEVEPLGELKDKAEPTKPVDLCNAGDANGKFDKSGCESRAEKDEPITTKATIKSGPQTIPKQKGVVHDVEGEEDVEEPQDDNDYKSEEEEEDGEGEDDEREVDGEPYEEEDEEEYVEDGDEDEGDDESEPPSKRRK